MPTYDEFTATSGDRKCFTGFGRAAKIEHKDLSYFPMKIYARAQEKRMEEETDKNKEKCKQCVALTISLCDEDYAIEFMVYGWWCVLYMVFFFWLNAYGVKYIYIIVSFAEIRTKFGWVQYSKALDIDWTSIIILQSIALYL